MNITLDDPRLTAFALHELDAAERKVVETEMQNFGECRREIKEIARTAALVSAGLAAEMMPAWEPTQQRTIEAELKRAGSKAKLSWIPSGENAGFARWGLKVALALAVVLLLGQVHFPRGIINSVQTCFAHATAWTAYAMIKMSGTRGVWTDGLRIASLPDGPLASTEQSRIGVEVVLACAVYYWVMSLLAASVLLGNLYLRSWWNRSLLTASVIPLTIGGTAFHVFILFESLLHEDGNLIYSAQRSGHIISALSLVPFFLLLVWLRKLEAKSVRLSTAEERVRRS